MTVSRGAKPADYTTYQKTGGKGHRGEQSRKKMYTTNSAQNGTGVVDDVLLNMTVFFVSDATRNAGSGTIGNVMFFGRWSAYPYGLGFTTPW